LNLLRPRCAQHGAPASALLIRFDLAPFGLVSPTTFSAARWRGEVYLRQTDGRGRCLVEAGHQRRQHRPRGADELADAVVAFIRRPDVAGGVHRDAKGTAEAAAGVAGGGSRESTKKLPWRARAARRMLSLPVDRPEVSGGIKQTLSSVIVSVYAHPGTSPDQARAQWLLECYAVYPTGSP